MNTSNTSLDSDSFDNPTQVIVGATSQTGGRQVRYIDSDKNNLLLTGSTQSLFHSENEEVTLPGLPLKNLSSINNAFYGDENSGNAGDGIRGQIGDQLTFGGELDVTLHAMSMQGLSKEYPKEVVAALDNANGSVRSVLLISYEAGHNPETNRNGSHVFYPVRDIKKQMEQSALEACENAKIIDLLTFDSKSAKKLGFTFLGVVGDFIKFLETQGDSEMKLYLKEFLGESYNGIIEMFQELPIRGELSEGQHSMKELAGEGKLNGYINKYAKKNNYSLYSRISGLVTELYLSASMKYMTDERASILGEKGERVLLDWDKISLVEGFDTMMADCLVALKDNESSFESKVVNEESSDFYVELRDSRCSDISYTLNPQHLDTISEHFGITPLVISEDLVYKSGLLKEGERIKVSNPNVMIFSGNDVRVVKTTGKKGEVIQLQNANNSSEVFVEFELTTENAEVTEAASAFVIPLKDNSDTPEIAFPHGLNWSTNHTNHIQTQINGTQISPKASIKEHIGFQLAGLLLDRPNSTTLDQLKEKFSRIEKYDPNKNNISGTFGKIETIYENIALFAKLPEKARPTLHINSMSYRGTSAMDTLIVEVDAIIDGQNLGRYKFTIN